MTNIIVKKGVYAKQPIQNQVFKMELSPRMGKKGMYVTVDGTPLGYKDRKVRIMIDSEADVTLADGNEVILPAKVEETYVEVEPESDEDIMRRMRKKFQIIDGMTMAAIEGNVRAMIITGPPGVGKTFGVESTIESRDVMLKMDLIDKDQANLRGKMGIEKVASASPLGLYQLLWEYSKPGSLLVLDDSDSLLYDEASLNMLKAVTDSGKKRKLTWRTESRVLDEAGVPFEFEFEGSVIFITNLDFENARGKIGDHLKAIVSRCHYVDVGIHGQREKFLRCKQIIRDGMLDRYKFDDTQVDEILNYIDENKGRLREISLRMVTKIADLVRMDPTGWRSFANETCLKGR